MSGIITNSGVKKFISADEPELVRHNNVSITNILGGHMCMTQLSLEAGSEKPCNCGKFLLIRKG